MPRFPKIFPLFLRILATTLLFQISAFAEIKKAGLSDSDLRDLVTAELNQQGIPGLTLAIYVDGEIRFNEGFGWADLEHRVPAAANTSYRTASIAKPMTATVLLRLVEQGKLDLDADIRKYYAGFPSKQWVVTSRQLLGHLGGIRHYKNRSEPQSARHFFDTASAIQVFADDPLVHEPGTKFLYSSFGYNLLGAVAEAVADRPFQQLLAQFVWEPAGMTATVVDDTFAIIPHRARGYARYSSAQIAQFPAGNRYQTGKLYNAPLHDTSMKIPAGGLLSTSGDLVQFAAALHGHVLLEEASLEQAWAAQVTADGGKTNYGLGWKIHDDGSISHSGGQAGTSTLLIHHPQHRIAVAAMCNLQRARLAPLCQTITKRLTATDSTTELVSRLTEAVQWEVKQKDLPAFSIALVDNDKTVWSAGFGVVNSKTKTPATADTVYRVGSVSKLFTDIAVMQLVERGELDLDANIRELLPSFQPENPHKKPLTLRQLMSHRSGLVRESPVGNYFDPTEPSLAATVASLNQTKLVYPPNTRTKYSNAGVSVVGFALQTKTKVGFEQYLKQTFLDPIGMNDSSFERTKNIDASLAEAWMWTVDGRRFVAPKFALGTAPAGSLYSSVNDLSIFLKVIFNGGKLGDLEVIKAATLKRMMTATKDADGKPRSFGIGFSLSDFEGQKSIGHGGAIYGFSTQLRALPVSKLGVAAVTSLDGANGVVRRLTDYALRLLLARKNGTELPSYERSKPLSTKLARELSGLYKSDDESLRLTERNGKLYLRRGSRRREIRQLNGRLVPDDVHGFGPIWDASSSDALVIAGTRFTRVPDSIPDEIPARWRGLIGEYGWDHNTLYILEDQGKLYALIEWFYYYPLTEISDSEFAFPDHGLYHGETLKFFRGGGYRRAAGVEAANVTFPRRDVGTESGTTFRIQPIRPVDELLKEAIEATPPEENGPFLRTDLIDVQKLEKSIKLDIRYASENNFMGSVFYRQERAFMQRQAAEAVRRVHGELASRGYGILIHDAYRPWYVTKTFWDATPGSMKDFVANPENGSRHNRGCAVDLTLYLLDSGKPAEMVAGYDEFSHRSFPAYPGGTSRQRWHRELLRQYMQQADFTIYEFEWWHFDYKDWRRYPILNKTFEQIEH
jgi:CubicO group peptidase (beta-lactamase class C family)/D-alanyl-D-alanine dipeptidase